MAKFIGGLLLGVGAGLLIAPRSGREMRRFLNERLQGLVEPEERAQLKQSIQQLPERTTQVISVVKDNAPHVIHNVGDVAQKTVATVAQTSKDTVSNVSDVAQKTATNVAQTSRNVASNLKGTVQKTTSDVAQTSKDSVNSVSDAAQKTMTNVSQVGKSTFNTVEQASTVAPQTPAPTKANVVEVDPAAEITSGGSLLKRIPGIEPVTQAKLEKVGIHTSSELLGSSSTKEERDELSSKAGIPTSVLRNLVTRADLMRLRGVGGNMVLLLEEAGVTGCKDLQNRNPEHLQTRLAEVETRQGIVSHIPDLEQVTEWVADAMRVVESSSGM